VRVGTRTSPLTRVLAPFPFPSAAGTSSLRGDAARSTPHSDPEALSRAHSGAADVEQGWAAGSPLLGHLRSERRNAGDGAGSGARELRFKHLRLKYGVKL